MFSESPDILILMLVAGFIFYKLYSVFGQHSDVSAPKDKNIDFGFNKIKEVENPQEFDSEPNLLLINDKLRDVLKLIKETDSSFSYNKFLKNAEKAFELIINAYAQGDKEFLKNMLTKEVYQSFSENIDINKENNQQLSTTIVSINNCQLIDASLENHIAKMTIKYSSEQINLVKDQLGNITSGNPSQVNNIEDIWVFKRNLKSSDPTWLLCETLST